MPFDVRTVSRVGFKLRKLKMLVLTRQTKEEIEITIGGQTVTLKVVSIDRDKVRLGFDASKEVVVDRKEVADRKRGAA